MAGRLLDKFRIPFEVLLAALGHPKYMLKQESGSCVILYDPDKDPYYAELLEFDRKGYRRSRRRQRRFRRFIRLLDIPLNALIILICVILFAVGGYALYDSVKMESDNSAAQWSAYKPGVENTDSFESLQAINPEVIGWLTIYGTYIDYPLLQGETSEKYLTLNPRGEYTLMGSIFLDSRSSPDFSDYSTIIYGHHIKTDELTGRDQMFGALDRFADYDYFIDHQYGYLYGGGIHHGIETMAFLEHIDAYDDLAYQVGIRDVTKEKAYVDYLLSKASFVRPDSQIAPDDHIAILSTCSTDGTNARTILIVKLYDDTFPNKFIGEPNLGTGLQTVIPEIPWGWIGLAYLTLPFLLFIVRRLGPLDIGRKSKRYDDRDRRPKWNEKNPNQDIPSDRYNPKLPLPDFVTPLPKGDGYLLGKIHLRLH